MTSKIDAETAWVWARLNAHEFLIEQLWASVLNQAKQPIQEAEEQGQQLTQLSKRVSMPTHFDNEIADFVAEQLRHALADIWAKVQTRVEQSVAS